MQEFPHQVIQLIDGLMDPAVLVDSERNILRFNPAYQVFADRRLRALQLAAAMGTRCCDVARLEICENGCVAAQALKTGHPVRLDEIKARPTPDGDRTLIVTAVPIDDRFVVETYRDVTVDARIQRRYRTLLEAEKRAKETLEQQVLQRTAELEAANEELRRAQAAMIHQEKMSGLGQLVTGVAHELNNPISFVYGNIDFLAEYVNNLLRFADAAFSLSDLSPAAKQTLATLREEIEYDYLRGDVTKLIGSMRNGAERTVSIVRDLKLFSRNQPGVLEESNLIEGIEATLNLISPFLKDRIRVIRDLAPIPKVRCNIGHMNQVFMNILTNAAQAIQGDGEILVRTASRPDGVRILIRDTGPGIAYENLSRVFEPFFTTKPAGEGTGLGLAISDGIVRQHGGQIIIESVPDYGTSFIIDLPLDPETSASDVPRLTLPPTP